MAIVKMNHFKLYSLQSETSKLLDFFQDYGKVHISNLSEYDEIEEFKESGLDIISEPKAILDVREELTDIKSTMDILEGYKIKVGALEKLKQPTTRMDYRELMDVGLNTDVSKIIEEVKSLDASILEKENEIDRLNDEISELRPWKKLNLTGKELSDTKHLVYITGYVPENQYQDLIKDINDLSLTFIEKAMDSNRNSYFLLTSHKEEKNKLQEVLNNYSFYEEKLDLVNSPTEEIDVKKSSIDSLKSEIDSEKSRLKDIYKNDLKKLEVRYDYLKQLEKKYETSTNILKTNKVLYIDGYIETSREKEFENLLLKNFGDNIVYETNNAELNDPYVPVKLKNNKVFEPFENVTTMYANPSYNELDPTPFLAPFFIMFFGMMVADVGYGLLMAIGTLLMMRFDLPDKTRKNMRFFFILSLGVIFWGLIYGSFFGGLIKMPMLVDLQSDYITVIIISLVLGLIHMFFALILKACVFIKNKEPEGVLYDVGSWYLLIGGGIYYILSGMLGLPGANIAKWAMIVGAVLIVLFTARDSETKVGRIAGGAYNLYGVSSWVGDIVSYVRLMALGLSGASIGLALNLIVGMIYDASAVAGIIAGIIIISFGHLANLGLSALSAYVHTLRLTFVEFFGKFYDGGGLKFDPVRYETKYLDIKSEEE